MDAHAPRRLRALVADDDPDTARMIKLTLEHEGVSVSVTHDGGDALQRLTQEKFDVLILDVTMPVKSGIEVLREVRWNPETENITVIMLTGKARDEDVMEGYQYGADVYLTKPFSIVELQTIVRAIS